MNRTRVWGLIKSHKGQNARGQKKPLRLAHLAAMLAARGAGGRGQEDQDLLQMRLAHAGFLRTAEHTEGKLRGVDVCFLVEEALVPRTGRVRFASTREEVVAVRLLLQMPKTGHLEVAPQEVLIGRRADELDVVGPLWDHCNRHGLLGTTRAVLTRLVSGGEARTEVPVSGAQFRAAIGLAMEHAGLDATGFSGHSPRRGACNDALDAGVALATVMKAGRWKSMAWMGYRALTAASAREIALVLPQKALADASVSIPYRMLMCLKEGSKQ